MTVTSARQITVWTALPTGWVNSSTLSLSVYAAPRLIPVTSGGSAHLSDFPDWADWPDTMGGASFTVQIGDQDPVDATIISGGLNSTYWKNVFSAADMTVTPFTAADDYSHHQFLSYDIMALHSLMQGLYGQTLLSGATSHPTAAVTAPNGRNPSWKLGPADTYAPITSPAAGTFADYDTYRNNTTATPGLLQSSVVPTYDFHQGVSALAAYPSLLRLFGIVFDLRIPAPDPSLFASSGGQTTVTVTASYTTNPPFARAGRSGQPPFWTIDLALYTQTVLTSTQFQPAKRSTANNDYKNGMLDLSDTSRFTVIDLDHDLTVDRGRSFGTALQQLQTSSLPATGSSFSAALPSPRSSGPTLVWTDFGDYLQQTATAQANLEAKLQGFLTGNAATTPTVYAEDLIRGHRFDVYTASDPSPTWCSLMGRTGNYTFGSGGTNAITAVDEGVVVPAATSDPADSADNLFVSERLMRWNGWSLVTQLPGQVVQTDGGALTAQSQPGNKLPSTDPSYPQLQATFSRPIAHSGVISFNPYPLPKLRYGNKYRFRARSVDLAGNGVEVSSSDESTATAAIKHFRYEPVLAPFVVPTNPMGVGESSLLLIIYNDGINSPSANGRWLFPVKASQMLCEKHGMFDGFSLGSPPDPSQPPAFDPTTWGYIRDRDPLQVSDAPGAVPDPDADEDNPRVYFPVTQTSTPYFTDPLSTGLAALGLPGSEDDVLVTPWDGPIWPTVDPLRLQLASGSSRATSVVAATGSANTTIRMTLPPAHTANLRLSSALNNAAISMLGLYDWLSQEATSAGTSIAPFLTAARNGQIWGLTPYRYVRVVHAVRVPLLAPSLSPHALSKRAAGDVSVSIDDPDVTVDENSTGFLDFEASWADPYDNPLDPECDPSVASKSTKTFKGHAFRVNVPDPNPPSPESQPLKVFPPKTSLVIGPSNETTTHHIGDTKHHLVSYTATASSRFAELFAKTLTGQTFNGTKPLQVGDSKLGINAASVVISGGPDGPTLLAGSGPTVTDGDYVVDQAAGTITLTSAGLTKGAGPYTITFQPTVTRSGQTVPVEVLSSAAPAAPKVARIMPAWEIAHSKNEHVKRGKVTSKRTGNYLRVFLDRPWFGTGADELLGVVTATSKAATKPTVDSQRLDTSIVGLDPITNPGSVTGAVWPFVPQFAGTTPLPIVKARTQTHYAMPAVLDSEHVVWPYAVAYDKVSGQWYADIEVKITGVNARNSAVHYPLPPGYFVRLSLVRFQPYSVDGQEFSTATTAMIAQPVPDRMVTAVLDHRDHKHQTVTVTVSGPGYDGWRPPVDVKRGAWAPTQKDADNPWSPPKYSTKDAVGSRHTSLMAVDVQVYEPSDGLSGDFGWRTIGTSTTLRPGFSSTNEITWGGAKKEGNVKLPHAVTSKKRMRLRVSEVEFHNGTSAGKVSSSQRRPFVTFLPLN